MIDEPRPYLSSFKDRHGKIRWRYRRGSKTVSIKGEPGDPAFEEAYLAALEGRSPRTAAVVNLPGAALPGSFRAAWGKVKRTPEWLMLDPASITKNTAMADILLSLPVLEGEPEQWGDMLVKDLKRRHVKEIIGRFSATPHKAKHLLVTLRKMIMVALEEEWIETDPTWKLNYRPEYRGWRAWTDSEREKFEARWPIGTTPRTVYALALWLGNRRSDVARLRWDWFDFRKGTMTLITTKGDKALVLPITPMLREAIEDLPRAGETVVITAYGLPFSAKSITGRMADWTHSAGLAPGCTLHGLRKTLGKMLAEAGATTRQLMETLGHDDIEHAELYSRAAEQQRLARDGMAKVSKLHQPKKKRG